MYQTVDIPALFESIVGKVSVNLRRDLDYGFSCYFAHGVYDSVKKALVEKGQSKDFKMERFPLIWLVTPFTQIPYPKGTDAYCELPDLQLLLLMPTNASRTEAENITDLFDPFLRPMYQELLKQIDRSNFFQVLSVESIPHEVKEWPYQHSTDGKANLFNDYINCIQIKRLRLLVNEPVTGTTIFNPNKRH